MKKKKTIFEKLSSAFQTIIYVLVGMVTAGVCIYFEEIFFGEEVTKTQVLMLMLGGFSLMFVSFILHIIVHEAGHLVGGLLSGYKFISFRVFNIMLIKTDGKLCVKRLSLAGTGGQCLMRPPEMRNGGIPVFSYNMGGSFMNYIFSSILVTISMLLNGAPIAQFVLIMLSICGFAFALANGIPMNTGLVTNDGYNAIKLSGDKAALRAFWIQMKMNEMMAYGKGIGDMPKEWFEIPSDEDMKNAMVSPLGVFGCNYLMEKREFEKAESTIQHLLSIESGIVGVHRSLMLCDRIYLRLMAGDTETATQLYDGDLKKFIKSMKNFPQVIRTEYAYALLCENDEAKAKTIMERFLKVEKTYPYPSDANSEKELMQIAESYKLK